MARLIDSSVFISVERRGVSLSALLGTTPGEPVALASITASELLTGVHRAGSAERTLRREAFVEAILQGIPVLSFNLMVARTHARLWAELAAVGQVIGEHDLMIAATALTHGYAVLTNNVREFQRVPGLEVIVPPW